MAIPELRRVLVPTDLSPFGTAAIPHGYSVLARGGIVHLVHVIEPVLVPNPLYAHYEAGKHPTPEQQERQKREIERRLLALVPVGAEERGITTRAEVFEAKDVARTICELADELDVDLVCVTSHGHSGILKAVLGSVSDTLLERMTRPVLIVRPSIRS